MNLLTLSKAAVAGLALWTATAAPASAQSSSELAPLIERMQRLERDLLMALQTEGPRDLPLACGRIGLGNEVEDLLAARQARGMWLTHVYSIGAIAPRVTPRASNP